MPKLALRLAVLAALVAAIGVAAASALETGASAQPAAVKSVSKTYSLGQCDNRFVCWQCNGPVDLDQLTVNVDTNADGVEAIKLGSGCTGRIGKITVLTRSADGLKVSSGAHDIAIGGGSITCSDRYGAIHQDGIQVMGGTDIEFRGLTVKCPTANHSAFFVNQGGDGEETPTRVLFVQGYLGSTGTTVAIGTSRKSGVRGSTVCPSTRLGFPFSIPAAPSGDGPAAISPVNANNKFPALC